ncbi:MAG: hypothetical protein KBF27_04010 [Cypionkella sp.]|nr:hypothetical protein [Cypionkella sp.]
MMGYVDDPRAWAYTRGMTRALGVNLTKAVVQGWVSRDHLQALVATCQSCAQTACCTDWLARTTRAEAVPGFCPNKPEIEALGGGF